MSTKIDFTSLKKEVEKVRLAQDHPADKILDVFAKLVEMCEKQQQVIDNLQAKVGQLDGEYSLHRPLR